MSNGFPYESFYSIKGVLLGPFFFVGLTLFLLGFYTLLFGLTVYSLCMWRTIDNAKLHLAWTCLLFIFSISASICKMVNVIKTSVLGFQAAVLHDYESLWDWESNSVPQIMSGIFSDIFYILSNCLTDAILLYRFFILWGSNWCICIVPAFALVAANVIGMIGTLIYMITGLNTESTNVKLWDMGAELRDIHYFMNAANSLVLTLIIAARLWWLSRDSRRLLGREVRQKYNSVIAIIIESGFMYSASLIIHASIRRSLSTFGFDLDTSPLISLMVGIAPTLIILRTSLGLSDSAVPNSQMLSTLQFRDPPQTASIECSEVHTVDIQPEQGSTNSNEDLEAQKHEATPSITTSKV